MVGGTKHVSMKDGKWRAERGIKESDIGLGQLWRVRRPVRDWTTVYIFQEWQWRYSFYMQTILYNYNQAFRYLVIFPNKSFQKVNKMSCNKNIKNTQHLFLFLAKKKKTKKKKTMHSEKKWSYIQVDQFRKFHHMNMKNNSWGFLTQN